MRIQLVCLSVLLAGLTMGSSGCIVLAAGAGAAGTVAYVKGDFEAELQHNIDETYAATQKATEELKLHVITGDGGKDALSATIVARDAADKRVTIKLKTVTDDITKLSIRVGTFGDKTKQRLIYDKIRDNLKAMSPQPAQAVTAAAQTPPGPAPQPSQAEPSAAAAPPAQDSSARPGGQEPPQPAPAAGASPQPAESSTISATR